MSSLRRMLRRGEFFDEFYSVVLVSFHLSGQELVHLTTQVLLLLTARVFLHLAVQGLVHLTVRCSFPSHIEEVFATMEMVSKISPKEIYIMVSLFLLV